jgi:beta-lactamase regulating signal transducer with metallopeptidase domain
MTILAGWLWQGCAMAAVTALALRCFPRLNAATRHAIWWLALLAVLLLPLAQPARTPPPATILAGGAAVAPSAAILLPAIPDAVVSGLGVVWLIACLVGATRVARGLRHLVRLKRESRPFDRAREQRLVMWASVRDAGPRTELRVGEVPGGAGALGLGRPVIVVSQRLVDRLDDAALDQIVLHEHAHLVRRDDWWRLVQAIVASVAGLHPAVGFINRRIDLEREAACDDHVVSRSGALKGYATCLADAAAIVGGHLVAPAVLPTAAGSRPVLAKRVERLLESRRLHTTGLAWPSCAASVVLVTALVAAMGTLGPGVGVRESGASLPPARAAATWPSDHAPGSADQRMVMGSGDRTGVTPPAKGRSTRAPRRQASPVSPAQAATTAAEEPLVTPPTSGDERAGGSSEPAPIEGRRLELAGNTITPPLVQSPALPTDASAGPAEAGLYGDPRDAPWIQAADAGVEMGARAKRSGLALGDFFTRAGKRVASAFTDPPAP